jgi:hypothetical protein
MYIVLSTRSLSWSLLTLQNTSTNCRRARPKQVVDACVSTTTRRLRQMYFDVVGEHKGTGQRGMQGVSHIEERQHAIHVNIHR